MKILVCPDSFKGTCSALKVADAIERGIKSALPEANVIKLPLADGGEGTVAALCAQNGTLISSQVHDPLMRPIKAEWGLTNKNVAVVEMATASGFENLAEHERNPLLTTTYGTGELIKAALDCPKIILGIGGSATNDGGVGMAQALGVRFYDKAGELMPNGIGGQQLSLIEKIDISQIDSRIKNVKIEAACDVNNPICGPNGAAFVYAPQKGASAQDVIVLDQALKHLSQVIKRDLAIDIEKMPGAGAAGGLGGGAYAFIGAQFCAGIDLVLEAQDFEKNLADAQLVIVGEGKIDHQSFMGKVFSGVLAFTKKSGVKTIGIAGMVDEIDQNDCQCFGLVNSGIDQSEAMAKPEFYLELLTSKIINQISL